jgi:hypothetical protein
MLGYIAQARAIGKASKNVAENLRITDGKHIEGGSAQSSVECHLHLPAALRRHDPEQQSVSLLGAKILLLYFGRTLSFPWRLRSLD